ncbi:MAG: biopolymer transporter ExbD [Candidatus Delongbacteria bacterium]|nr:biopolymer transporter ExbD [Candidatus Delongbacteria bacterium]
MFVGERRARVAEIPTASMADIAFLLLIFFLVTTTIDSDKGISLTLPAMGEDFKVQTQIITNILINDAGQVLIDDANVGLQQVRETISQIVQQSPLDENGRPRQIFSILTGKLTKYGIFIDVLDQVKQAGATKISIAEPRE